MTPSPCGCRVELQPISLIRFIVYCPLHAAASDMLAALKRADSIAHKSAGVIDEPFPDNKCKFHAIIARAEGKG